MKIRISLLLCMTTAPVLIAGCATYKNSSTCERMMRSTLAEKSSDKLSISHAGVGIDGSRVVVEGQIESPPAPVAPASAAVDASAAASASAPLIASASAPMPASAPAAKPKKQLKPAAVECTFNGTTLGSLRWMAPPDMVKKAEDAEDAE